MEKDHNRDLYGNLCGVMTGGLLIRMLSNECQEAIYDMYSSGSSESNCKATTMVVLW